MAPKACFLLVAMLAVIRPVTSTLYPELEPHQTGMLNVSSIHSLYYEVSGNPDGEPALFLHGGPGGGTSSRDRRFFDPEFYRIVVFDQRGCGKSTPSSELTDNTTWDLVDDIERLRIFLGIDKWWTVLGGSWGSTLALTYAEVHPNRVSHLVLRGIYTHREGEMEYLYEFGASEVFPEIHEVFVKYIPLLERNNLVAAYYRRMIGNDPVVALEAARQWATYECKIAKLQPDFDGCEAETDKDVWEIGRIECHYFYNDMFFSTPNQVLNNVNLIRHIPTTIVHGRYDTICPVRNAYALHEVFPEADLQIADVSGHSATEEQITEMLVAATNKYRSL